MRLTVDVIQRAQISINPLKQRELNLRGYKAPAIENLGVTKDGFDCIDLSDNEIKKLENFPRLRRLRTLLLNNNHVSKFQENLADSIENLEYLILTGNRVAQLSEIDHLASLKKLDTLSLVGNPVAKRKYYREYVVHRLPQLRVLDFQKIKPRERDAAAVFFNSLAGKRVEQEAASGVESNGEAALASSLPPPPPPPTFVNNAPPPPPKPHAAAPPPPPPAPATTRANVPAAAKPVSPVNPPPVPMKSETPVPVKVETPPPAPTKRGAEDVDMDAPASPAKRAARARAEAQTTPAKTAAAGADVEMAAVPYTPSKPIASLTVTQLRGALKELGLPTKGLKAELVKRLKEAAGKP